MRRKSRAFPRVLVTAGPTREWLDPVRFLTNPSTGVMGYEIARAARQKGLAVTLVTGKTALRPPKGVRVILFESAEDLSRILTSEFPRHDALFMTAAVGDYTPVTVRKNKIKRKSTLAVTFRQTPDLVAGLQKLKKHQIVAGFCLETENLEANARAKLKSKKLDYIVANYFGRGAQPFGTGKTTVMVFDRSGRKTVFRDMSKKVLAGKLVDKIILTECTL